MLNFIRSLQFRPKWFFTVITVLFSILFINLGFWQLHRADEKQQLQQHFESQQHQPPTPFYQFNQKLRFQNVLLEGHFDNSHNFLLDNKIHNHQIGYEVLSPFVITENNRTILVNRGWISAANRSATPKIPAVMGQQTIVGKLFIPTQKSFTLGKITEQTISWPLRIQALDFEATGILLQQNLYPMVVLLDPKSPYGFVRDWQPVSMPAYKHTGYAVQWFTFAVTLIIIFVVLNLRRVRR
jgi:surfeit locus 1 family protein